MMMTRLLTATAMVALFAGPVAAQVTNNTPSSGQTSDAEGQTPATSNDTAAQSATTTPPTAPGDRTTDTTGATSATGQGSMTGQGSTTAGGAMGTTSSGNTTAGGTMGSTASGNMAAGGEMGATAGAGGLMTSMNGGVRVTSNAPIPDTAENRARYGQPESNAGRSRVGEGPTGQLAGRRRR